MTPSNAIGSPTDFEFPVDEGEGSLDPEGEVVVPLESQQARKDAEDLLRQQQSGVKHPRE